MDESVIDALRAVSETIAEASPTAADICRRGAEELETAREKIFVPGHWECPKCQFYLVTTTLDASSGGFAADNKPQMCANGCGPMWRVTHEQSANTMMDRTEPMLDAIKCLNFLPALVPTSCLDPLITKSPNIDPDFVRDNGTQIEALLRLVARYLHESAEKVNRCGLLPVPVRDLQPRMEELESACVDRSD
jgi:hypothetical protein